MRFLKVKNFEISSHKNENRWGNLQNSEPQLVRFWDLYLFLKTEYVVKDLYHIEHPVKFWLKHYEYNIHFFSLLQMHLCLNCVCFFFWDVEIHHKSKYLKNSSRLISTMIFKSVVKFRVFHEKIWVWCLPLCWDTDTFLYTFRMYHYWCSIISRLNRIQKHYCTSVIEYSVIVETPWIFERRNVEWKIWDIDLNSYDKDHKPQF